MIGNHAVQYLRQSKAENLATRLVSNASTAFTHGVGRIPVYASARSHVQPKLKINAPGDQYEQEADRVADQVMRMPEPQLQRACTGAGECPKCQTKQSDQTHKLLHAKHVSTSASEQATAPPIVHDALRSSGRPLDSATRAFMESRLGHNLSRVRLHTSTRDAQSARSVNAYAYTVRNHIFFGENQYQPKTSAGRKLLAHELAHVIQSDNVDSTVRRAEVEDRDSVCSSLTDISSDVNRFVNAALSMARSAPGVTPISPFLEKVLVETGGTGAVGPIEDFIKALPASKRFLPSASLAGTRFSSLPSASGLAIPGIDIPVVGELNIYDAHSSGFIHVVGATALINGKCVGADKLGHFFQQGAQYFSIQARSSLADAESFGRATEISRAGLGATGVFSNGDLAANRAGLRFWEQLVADPAGFSFDIADYIADDWNEQSNPNFYEPSVAREVWATQLTGRWQGVFGLGPSLRDIKVALTATNTGSVTGSFEYKPSGSAALVTGTINGTIAFQTRRVSGSISSSVLHGSSGSHSASPVSGIEIEFDWVSGSNRGKGKWESIGEQMLIGDFGRATSRTDGGSFNIVRR